MSETSNTPEYDKFKARCIEAVEGMKFFDQPVQDMTAEELLVVVGHLVTENVRLQPWIPIAAQLPDRNVNVLIHIPVADEKTCIASLDEGGMWFSTDPTADAYSLGEDGAPTHWMPLPAPPSDGK